MAGRSETEAIIVGGGIGGLAAAIALRQAGLEVTVCERAPALEPVGAGLSLWANAITALDRLGLGAEARAIGLPVRDGALRTKRGDVLARQSSTALEQRFGELGLGLHRAELQGLLAGALPPAVLRLGMTCVSVTGDGEGVGVGFADGSRLSGRLLIGADGLRSIVRAHLHGAHAPRYAGYTAWRGVTAFPHDRLRPGETWGCGLRCGHIGLSGGRVYWFAVANAAEGALDSSAEAKSDLLRRFGDWHDSIPALIAATDERAIFRTDIYDRPPLRRWGAGRITLLGDAAHPMTPNLGQGACQALEDAVVLGASLRGASDVAAALRVYEAQRLARTSAMVRQSYRIGQVAQWEHPLACRLRDAALRLIPARLQERQLKSMLDYSL